MERINKELIRKGIEQDIIFFDMEDDLLVACIGDYWFFISSEPYKEKESFSDEQLVDMVYEAVNNTPINDDDEEQATECLYYKAVLLERIV